MTPTETPSALLRRAADRLDELVGAATKGPWTARHRSDDTHRVIGGPSPMPGHATDNRTVCRDGGYPADWPADVVNPAADIDYIAAVDPLVGRAFAVMLRTEARSNAGDEDHTGCTPDACTTVAAMIAARRILGEGA